MGHDHHNELKDTRWNFVNMHAQIVASIHFDHHHKVHWSGQQGTS